MYKLLVINFLIKLYALKNIFEFILEKYGQSTLKVVRSLEKKRTKLTKVKYDLKFLSTCKRNGLLPTFAKPKLAIKINQYTQKKIAKTIIETEMRNKHKKLNWLKKEIRKDINELNFSIGYISLCSVNISINKSINGKKKEWKRIHENKLETLFSKKRPELDFKTRPCNVVHNFSSYKLTSEENYILSFGLDHHIPSRIDHNGIKTEFEEFYYHLDKNFSHLNSEEISTLKSKLRRTCENYIAVPIKKKYDEVISNLSKNKKIVIMKQDKGKGVVLMDRTKYVEKCMSHLNTPNFKKLLSDPTQRTEKTIQKHLLKIKNDIGEVTYNEIYPSGSNPGKFYGVAKIHKLNDNDVLDIRSIDKVPIRPIISNIGTATYNTAKYLTKLLAPLAISEYTVNSTNEFIKKISKVKPPKGYHMISFDVVSLFTNVPLERTISIILDKVYQEKLIKTKISRETLNALLHLCTKEVHFTFNEEIYQQLDGVAMGSPLGPLFANIFMSELEKTLIPKVEGKLNMWTRYVDDTFAFIRRDEIKNVEVILNSFESKIQFTHEEEKDNNISFLDVQIKRLNDKLETSIYRKKTNTDLYINWYSHAPEIWKIGTLRNLLKRAITICSNPDVLEKEVNHLKKVFCETNQYPYKVVGDIIDDEIKKQRETSEEEKHEEKERTTNLDDKKLLILNLPYNGQKGQSLINKFKKELNKKLGDQVKLRVTYKSTKLNSRFQLKDKTKIDHLQNVTYKIKCPNIRCESNYVGQTKCRIAKRVLEHNSRDKSSHVLSHSRENKHRRVWLNDVTILSKGYTNNFKRKISESLFIKELRPDLNKQKDSYKLKLFN